jgi:lambda repressor-like predicted transcriptional regulator
MTDHFSIKSSGTPPSARERPSSFVSMIYSVEPTEPASLPLHPEEIPVLPSPPAAEIKRALKKRGVSLGEIAQRAGFSRAYTGRVIKGERHCPKIARMVAEILGVTPVWLWPDYQDSPYKRGPRPKRAHRGFARVSQAQYELKKNLKQWGLSITRLAQIVKRARSTVSAVINRIATAAPTAWAIIHALFDQPQWEKLFEMFFPDYTPLNKGINIPLYLPFLGNGRQRLKAGGFLEQGRDACQYPSRNTREPARYTS